MGGEVGCIVSFLSIFFGFRSFELRILHVVMVLGGRSLEGDN